MFCNLLFGRYIDWQEPQIQKKLHLNKEVKRVIGKQLVEVFNNLQKINDKDVFTNLQKTNNEGEIKKLQKSSDNNKGVINNLQKTKINQVAEMKKVEECIVSRARVCGDSIDKSSRLAMKYKAAMEF